MSQFMGEDISPSCYGKSFADIDRFGLVIPNPICIRVLPVHFCISDLPYHDVVAERKDDLIWYSHRALILSTMNRA